MNIDTQPPDPISLSESFTKSTTTTITTTTQKYFSRIDTSSRCSVMHGRFRLLAKHKHARCWDLIACEMFD